MYDAFIPLLATALLAVTVARWASDELAREGRLSTAAAAGATALAVLHGLIVVLSAAGGVGAVDVSAGAAGAVGGVAALAGGVLAIAAAVETGSWRRMFLVEPAPRPDGPVHRRVGHPLHLGWGAFLLGVAVAGRSVLALVLAVAAALWLWRLARSDARRRQPLAHA